MLMEQYQEKLYWQIRRIVKEHEDTNDILQNVLIKVFQSILQFKEESRLSTWLFRISYNETMNHLQQQKKMNLSDWEMSVKTVEGLEDKEDLDKKTFDELVQTAISLLPEKQQLVFKMRYFEEQSYEDMQNILGTTAGALKASYHHAVKKIESFVKQHLNQPNK